MTGELRKAVRGVPASQCAHSFCCSSLFCCLQEIQEEEKKLIFEWSEGRTLAQVHTLILANETF